MASRQTGRGRGALVAVLAAVAAVAASAAAGPAGARAAHVYAPLAARAATETSANWAGYVVSAPSTTYTSVTGSWRQPKVTCGEGDAGSSSAFWVGLGGYDESSQALEQAGTSSDCDPVTGRPSYSAWYELVPNASVTIPGLRVLAGDLITTSVNVLDGTTIQVQVKNRTRHTVFTKSLPFERPDVTSAEWIAEAPSDCSSYHCRPIPLANFRAVAFTRLAARGNGAGGTLTANPGWTTTAIELVPERARAFLPGPARYAGLSGSTAGAAPGEAAADGRSFRVDWTVGP
jgi:hypothetical protein